MSLLLRGVRRGSPHSIYTGRGGRQSANAIILRSQAAAPRPASPRTVAPLVGASASWVEARPQRAGSVKTYNLPGPKAREVLDRDRAVVSPSYPRATPFVMDHGKGSEVWDVDGNRFVDLAAGIAVCSTGHSHPKLVEAVTAQAQKFLHISSDYYHPAWVHLSDRLAGIAPLPGAAAGLPGKSPPGGAQR